MVRISVARARDGLSQLLKRVGDEPITITRRGKAVGVIISPNEYERLRRVQAYLKMIRLSQSLAESDLSAEELFRSSRAELEDRE
jgi:prevent-host-death family protein